MKKKTQKSSSMNSLVKKRDLIEVEMKFDKSLKDVEERLNRRIDRVIEYIDFRIQPFEEMRRDFYDFKSKILDRLDWLIGRYQKFEEEYTFQVEQNRRTLDRIENHEARITKIEGTVNSN